jgi:hypothetical protein
MQLSRVQRGWKLQPSPQGRVAAATGSKFEEPAMHQRAVIRKVVASFAIMLIGATIALSAPFIAGHRHEAHARAHAESIAG